MDAADADRFSRLFEAVYEYYDKPMSATRVSLYFNALAGYPYDVVQDAIGRHMLASRFFPQAADLRALIEGSEEDKIELSWATTLEAVARIGEITSVIVEDPALAHAIVRTFGGWILACQQLREADTFARQQFKRVFAAAYRVGRTKRETEPVLLSGRAHVDNVGAFRLQQVWFAVITAGGDITQRHLSVNEQTLLPVTPLRDVLRLPPQSVRLLMSASDEHKYDNAPPCTREEFFERLHTMVDRKGFNRAYGRRDIDELTDAEFSERRNALLAQAGFINGNRQIIESRSRNAVSAEADVTSSSDQGRRRANRRPTRSGRHAEAGQRVSVRKGK